MPDILIRTAAADDLEIIAANNAAMALETEGRALDAETIRSGVGRVLADSTRGVYYLAEVDGKAAGQLLITREWTDWRDGWFWWIQSVYVSPDSRGAGVYKALHRHIEAAARAEPDVRGVRLYVERENVSAQRVYEHLGMKRTGYLFYEIDWSAEGEA